MIDMVKTMNRGRCAIAKKRIERGTGVMEEEAVAQAVTGDGRCGWCLGEMDEEGGYYCGEKCRERDGAAMERWKGALTPTMVLVVRLLWREVEREDGQGGGEGGTGECHMAI